MMQGINDTFNAAFFIGYHSMASAFPSVLGHTYYGRVVYNMKINNRVMGETGINAALAGYYNVPVALVSGDDAVTREATELLGRVETVTVKKAVGRYAAQCLTPNNARKKIKEAAYNAMKKLANSNLSS
jgi:D-amino peptidase